MVSKSLPSRFSASHTYSPKSIYTPYSIYTYRIAPWSRSPCPAGSRPRTRTRRSRRCRWTARAGWGWRWCRRPRTPLCGTSTSGRGSCRPSSTPSPRSGTPGSRTPGSSPCPCSGQSSCWAAGFREELHWKIRGWYEMSARITPILSSRVRIRVRFKIRVRFRDRLGWI